MTRIYNVWIIVEELDEEVNENGNDIYTHKIGKFSDEEEALNFAKGVDDYE